MPLLQVFILVTRQTVSLQAGENRICNMFAERPLLYLVYGIKVVLVHF